MACSTNPLSDPVLEYCWLDPEAPTSVKFELKFIQLLLKCISRCSLKYGRHKSCLGFNVLKRIKTVHMEYGCTKYIGLQVKPMREVNNIQHHWSSFVFEIYFIYIYIYINPKKSKKPSPPCLTRQAVVWDTDSKMGHDAGHCWLHPHTTKATCAKSETTLLIILTWDHVSHTNRQTLPRSVRYSKLMVSINSIKSWSITI